MYKLNIFQDFLNLRLQYNRSGQITKLQTEVSHVFFKFWKSSDHNRLQLKTSKVFLICSSNQIMTYHQLKISQIFLDFPKSSDHDQLQTEDLKSLLEIFKSSWNPKVARWNYKLKLLQIFLNLPNL